MTLTRPKRKTTSNPPIKGTRFTKTLLFAFVGYMFLDRTFAWLIHVPGVPVFLGEIVLVLGAVELMRGKQAFRFLVARSATAKWILAFLALGFARLAADIGRYQLEAVRDSAIFYYAAFALIVATYVMQNPEVVRNAIKSYDRIVPWYFLWAPVAVFLGRTYSGIVPTIPGSLTSIFSFKGGNYAVWLAIGVAYLWLVGSPTTPAEIRRRSALTALGTGGLFVAGTQNRGGLLVGLAVIGFTVLLSTRPSRTLFRIAGISFVMFGLLFAMDARIETGKREISVRQIVENVQSVFSDGEDSTLDGTKRWRLALWTGITQDVVYGDFPFGFGMGPNIAERYNSVPVQLDAFQTLRSAHNSHLGILARMGIPGLTIWTALWSTFVVAALRIRQRLRRTDPEAAGVLTWFLIAVVAIMGNATFDPTLEGPQVAIPLYVFAGAALGMIARVSAGYPALKQTKPGLDP